MSLRLTALRLFKNCPSLGHCFWKNLLMFVSLRGLNCWCSMLPLTLSLDAESRCSEPSPEFSLMSGAKPRASSMFHLLSVHSVGSPALGTFSPIFLDVVASLSLRNQKYEERAARNFVWYSAISQIFLLAGTSFLNVSHTSALPSRNKFWIKRKHPHGHSLLLLLLSKAAVTATVPFQTVFTFQTPPYSPWMNCWKWVSSAHWNTLTCKGRHCPVVWHVVSTCNNLQ
jgi:hypothetical protein